MAPDGTHEYEWVDAVCDSIRIWASPERAATWATVLDSTSIPMSIWGVTDEQDEDAYSGLYFASALEGLPDEIWYGRDTSEALNEITDVLGAKRARGDESLTPRLGEDAKPARLVGMGILVREKHTAIDMISDSIYLVDESPEMYVARFCGTDMMIVDHVPSPEMGTVDIRALCLNPRTIHMPVHFALHNLWLTAQYTREECAELWGGPEGTTILAEYAGRWAPALEFTDFGVIVHPDNRIN